MCKQLAGFHGSFQAFGRSDELQNAVVSNVSTNTLKT
jgi:hypothetical protein